MFPNEGPHQDIESTPEHILGEVAEITDFWLAREIIEGRNTTPECKEELKGRGILEDSRLSLSVLAEPLLKNIPMDGKGQSTLARKLKALLIIAKIRGDNPEEYEALARALVQINHQRETALTLKLANSLHYAISVLNNKRPRYQGDLEKDLHDLSNYVQQLQGSFEDEYGLGVLFELSEFELSKFPYQNPLYDGEPLYFAKYYIGRVGVVDEPLKTDSEGYGLAYGSCGLRMMSTRGDPLGLIDFCPWGNVNPNDELPLEMVLWAGIRGLQNLVHAIDNGVLGVEEFPPIILGQTNRRMADFATRYLGFEAHTPSYLQEKCENIINVTISSKKLLENARVLLSSDRIQRLQERVMSLLQEHPKDWPPFHSKLDDMLPPDEEEW